MMECFDNAQAIAENIAAQTGDTSYAEEERKKIEANKPSEKFNNIVSHIEDKYNCSGLCQPPLFYFTQSITKGPPQQACMEPLIEDMGLLM